MRTRQPGFPIRVNLFESGDHIGEMLEHVVEIDLISGRRLEWIGDNVKIVNHVGTERRVDINADCTGPLLGAQPRSRIIDRTGGHGRLDIMNADEGRRVNRAHRRHGGPARVRIGFYSHASRLGGAERTFEMSCVGWTRRSSRSTFSSPHGGNSSIFWAFGSGEI